MIIKRRFARQKEYPIHNTSFNLHRMEPPENAPEKREEGRTSTGNSPAVGAAKQPESGATGTTSEIERDSESSKTSIWNKITSLFNKQRDKPEEKRKIFYYTWWAFEKVEDVAFLDSEGYYPREISRLNKAWYNELRTKHEDIIFDNHKGTGRVTGVFLGMDGVTDVEENFEDKSLTLPTELFDEYPVIGLGVSVPFLHELQLVKNNKERYGLLNPEEYRWRWTYRLAKEVKNGGTIKGRVVWEDKSRTEGVASRFPLSDEREAEKVIISTKDIGVKKPTIKVYSKDTRNEIKNVKAYIDDQGRFTITNIPINEPLIIKATKRKASQIPHTKGFPTTHITLTPTHPSYDKVVIPLKEKEEEPPVVKIVPTHDKKALKKRLKQKQPNKGPFGEADPIKSRGGNRFEATFTVYSKKQFEAKPYLLFCDKNGSYADIIEKAVNKSKIVIKDDEYEYPCNELKKLKKDDKIDADFTFNNNFKKGETYFLYCVLLKDKEGEEEVGWRGERGRLRWKRSSKNVSDNEQAERDNKVYDFDLIPITKET